MLFCYSYHAYGHSLYLCHWVFAEIYNLDWILFGHNDLVSNGKACYMFLAYMYTGVELFYVSGCLAGYQLD